MYGLVNRAVQELVIKNFGEDAWHQVCRKAGVEVDLFISNESYDDSITYDLVAATSEITGLSAGKILYDFGEHWIIHTGHKGYGALMEGGGKSFSEFLINLPNFHTRVVMIFPKLRPPEFAVSEVAGNSLCLHYHSERVGLTDFVKGLIHGLGNKFKVSTRATLIASKSDGADHDIFLVEWWEE
jgi:hypothetical protein